MQNYIYGAGGHGKVVLDAMQKAQISCISYIDDRKISSWAGLKVCALSDLPMSEEACFHLAIGDSMVREKIANNLSLAKYFSVVHPTSVVAATANIGLGTFLAAQSVIGPDAQIGQHCIVNHAAVLDHDCAIGDFTHIAPLASVGGGVRIGKCVLVGAGAVILPGIKVGDYAIIGAGAVVTKNVASSITVVGIPARDVKQSSK